MDETNRIARELTGVGVRRFFSMAGRCCLLAGVVLGAADAARAQESSDWTAEVGIIALKKGDPDSTLLFVAPNTLAPLFNASAFNFDFEVGPDVTLSKAFGDGGLIKARVFGIDGWSDSKFFVGPTGANINSIPPVGGPPPALPRYVQLEYTSELFSAEINCGTAVHDNLTFIAGFRYLEINEELDTFRTNPAVAGDFASIVVQTHNALYGLQIGGEANLYSSGLFRIDSFLKVGLFANDARSSLDYVQTIGPDWFNKDDTTHVTWMSEVGVSGTLHLTSSISIKAGYQILWLTDIAEAGEQIPKFEIVPLPAIGNGIDVNGTTFYHGANAQLVFTW